MKPTTLLAAIAIALLVFGCQDNDSFSPLAGPTSQTAPMGKPAPGSAVYLPLSGVMLDPVNGAVEISGGIDVYINGQSALEVTLRTKAELTPFNRDPIPWYINEKSTDWIKLEVGVSYFLMKTYKTTERQDGAALRVLISFNRNASDRVDNAPTVELVKVYLDVPTQDSATNPTTD